MSGKEKSKGEGPHSEKDRKLMLEGVRRERKRWTDSFAKAGIPLSMTRGPEGAAEILRYKIQLAKELAWEEAKYQAKAHIEKCESACALEIYQALVAKGEDSPPNFKDEEEEERPPNWFD